jgi:hypothetical protein
LKAIDIVFVFLLVCSLANAVYFRENLPNMFLKNGFHLKLESMYWVPLFTIGKLDKPLKSDIGKEN